VSIMKYSFRSDYCELAHPEVLAALNAVGTKQFGGYGLDEFSERAAVLIKKKVNLHHLASVRLSQACRGCPG